MCAELAHQHALDDLHKNTEHWANQEVDQGMFLNSNIQKTGTMNSG